MTGTGCEDEIPALSPSPPLRRRRRRRLVPVSVAVTICIDLKSIYCLR